MLMAGGSMFVGQMPYPEKQDPPTYISPELCQAIQQSMLWIKLLRQSLSTM